MYVLLGANGNITSKAAQILLSQGKSVRVVGRNAASLATIKSKGATVAIGDVADVNFLAEAMRGAEAVYSMIPPNYAAADMRADQNRLGEAVARAIEMSGVKRIVNLSSVGAHLASGTGPIAALHEQEQRLNRITGIDVLHLRPGYFFENHLGAIGTIKALGVYAGMADAETPIPTIGTNDIAVVVARELVNSGFKGTSVLHLRSEKMVTSSEAATILGRAAGKADLQYVKADPVHAKAGMVQVGFSADVADRFEEMSAAFSRPEFSEAILRGPTELTPTTLEAFAATTFKTAFEGVPEEGRKAA